jgi:hypothetical protein
MRPPVYRSRDYSPAHTQGAEESVVVFRLGVLEFDHKEIDSHGGVPMKGMLQMRAGPGASTPSVLTGHPFDPTDIELVGGLHRHVPRAPGALRRR